MPPVLQDVMRDLIANARKYTEPGGEITAGLVDNGKELRFVVEDTGRGIPADEVQQAVAFGTRGSNVADKATMGGGFGLTKAWWVTRQFGGRMWIASDPGSGTRITIRIPHPAA
jgi:signal transduction histidine kinase